MGDSRAPPKLLVTGGTRTVQHRVGHPKLHCFPISFNSAKAILACSISSASDQFEIIKVLVIADNCKVPFARLNPNMTVPAFEIDDKVITDSLDVALYMMDNYPGAGDSKMLAQGRGEEVKAFARLMAKWDEYQLSYGSLDPKMTTMVNDIRLINLRKSLEEVLDSSYEDRVQLKEAFVEKIATINNMKYAITGVTDERKKAEMDKNWDFLMTVCGDANKLLEASTGHFLFGDDLTTADCFFLPLFTRLAECKLLSKLYESYPQFEKYWVEAQKRPELHKGFLLSKPTQACMMLKAGMLKHVLRYKCGCDRAPALPDEVEKRITERFEVLKASTRA